MTSFFSAARAEINPSGQADEGCCTGGLPSPQLTSSQCKPLPLGHLRSKAEHRALVQGEWTSLFPSGHHSTNFSCPLGRGHATGVRARNPSTVGSGESQKREGDRAAFLGQCPGEKEKLPPLPKLARQKACSMKPERAQRL